MFEGFTETEIETSGAVIRLRHGGSGPPLLLLHGYPQTHVMWHKVAPGLAERYTVVVPDLRGYGDSSKPPTDATHFPYSKRAMARDQVEVMAALGHETFFVAGHDRGGRVGHRMTLDHAERVRKLAVLDIIPTRTLYATVNQEVATGYYHWFFLIQPYDLPETLIGADARYYMLNKMGMWSAVDGGITEAAMAEYLRCFTPETIHATCEDYRAAATIDLEHDEADIDSQIACPVLALWGAKALMARTHDVVATWKERAVDVSGWALPCGHYLPEEAPEETIEAFMGFFT